METMQLPQLVTIFGGSGFVGRHIVRALAKRGYRIRVATRRPDLAFHLQSLGNVGQIMPVQANLRYRDSVDAAVAGADHVINCVGILSESGRNTFDAVQDFGARAIAEATRAAGATLTHISAIGADAESESDYARTKGLAENAIRKIKPDAVILRPSIVFGPEDDFFNRFAVLARLMPVLPLYGVMPKVEFTGMMEPPRLDIYGTGGTRFQPVYVGDVAEAAMRILADEGQQGATYELGGPRCYSFKEILELLLDEIGRKRLIMPLPFWIARIHAAFLELMPVPPLTRDQVDLLKRDNVVSEGALTLADLGIEPVAAEAVVPGYLDRFRLHGRWSRQRVA